VWFRQHWKCTRRLPSDCSPDRTSSNPAQAGSYNSCLGDRAPANIQDCPLKSWAWSCKVLAVQLHGRKLLPEAAIIAFTLVSVCGQLFTMYPSRWILTARFKIHFFEFQNKIFKSLYGQMFDMILNSVLSYINLFLPSACTYIIISYSIKWFNEHFSLYFSMRKWKGIWQKNQIFKIHFFGFSNKILKWLQNDIVTVLFYPIGKWLCLQVCIHVSLSRSLS